MSNIDSMPLKRRDRKHIAWKFIALGFRFYFILALVIDAIITTLSSPNIDCQSLNISKTGQYQPSTTPG